MKDYGWIENELAEYRQKTIKITDILDVEELSLIVVTYKEEKKTKRVAVFIGEEMVWNKLTDITSAKEAMLCYMRYASFRKVPEGIKRLSESDVQILRNLGYNEEDLPYIDNAIGKTKLIMCKDGTNKRISVKKAREILGDERFLAGMGRSTFHRTTSQENESGVMVAFEAY
jgi:hypothetical protein